MLDLDVHRAAIAAGDAQAFGRWTAGVEPSLRHALRPFATRVDAEAVLQETLLRIWQLAGRIHPDGRPNTLLRFAIRVAQNLARSEGRRIRPEAQEDRALEDAAALAALAPSEPDHRLREQVQVCFDKLPAQPARAMRARLGGGEADPALAAALGMRLNTFLQNITRARRLLQDCLAKAGISLEEVLR